MSEPWYFIKAVGSLCPCGVAGSAVLEGESNRCISHGHIGLPEAMRWARDHHYRLRFTDSQLEWLKGWCEREGIALPEKWTAYEALDLLDQGGQTR